jgi:hypothetical protein
MTELHIIPDAWSTWRVYEANTAAALSEHTNATEAELAARARARAEDRDADRVVVHDRYHRMHDAATALPAELRARARHARARQLAAVRDRTQQLNRTCQPEQPIRPG